MNQDRAAVATEIEVKKFNERTVTRGDGSKVIPIQDGLFDLFQGDGWKHQSRFRIIRIRAAANGAPSRQLIQVSGLTLSQELRAQLLKEIH